LQKATAVKPWSFTSHNNSFETIAAGKRGVLALKSPMARLLDAGGKKYSTPAVEFPYYKDRMFSNVRDSLKIGEVRQ
jgi:hypothetical protein